MTLDPTKLLPHFLPISPLRSAAHEPDCDHKAQHQLGYPKVCREKSSAQGSNGLQHGSSSGLTEAQLSCFTLSNSRQSALYKATENDPPGLAIYA